MSVALRTLAYSSHAVRAMEILELGELLRKAQAFNQMVSVTGLLMFDGVNFLQTIEGPIASITTVYERICADARHRDLDLLIDERIECRAYPAWAMMDNAGMPTPILQAFLNLRIERKDDAITVGQLSMLARMRDFIDRAEKHDGWR